MNPARSLPRSAESERAVLGCMMMDRGARDEAIEHLTPGDFYTERHGVLFGLMAQMAKADEPAEMLAVVEHVVARNMAEQVGGVSYVASICDHIPSVENVGFYINSILNRATARTVITATDKIRDAAMNGGLSAEALVDLAETALAQAVEGRVTTQWTPLSGPIDESVIELQRRAASPGEVMGLSTGLVDLDRLLAGLHPTDLLILAARPAMGKTALALNIARSVADQAAVGFFSLEMAKRQLSDRLLCAEARFDAGRFRTGRVLADEWPAIQDAAERLHKLPLYIDDTPGISIAALRSKARRLKRLRPDLALIVVDYIGLMAGERGMPREQQVAQCSNGLKALAKELNITVLCLSQLNRGVEARNPKIPQLSDLRESGAIEQDADVILFIYRDEYYNKDSPRIGEADIIAAKQRSGETGVVATAFEGRHLRFGDLSTRDRDGYM